MLLFIWIEWIKVSDCTSLAHQSFSAMLEVGLGFLGRIFYLHFEVSN